MSTSCPPGIPRLLGLTLALVLLLLPQQHGWAQEAGPLQDLLPRIDALFSEWEGTQGPGCALGVVQDGSLVVNRGYGMGNLDHGVPLTGGSVFYLASVSKQFTAAAVALASMEGHLSLDDDIRAHFPELPDYGPTISIRNLIHHTSGLRDYLTLMSLAAMPLENAYTDQEIHDLIFRQEELNFPPGEEYLYSNTNYVLLAELIHRTTGKTLAEYTQDRVFGPLGMSSTHFHDDAGVVVPGRVFSYAGNPATGYRSNYLMNFDKVGDGGLYSSVEDLYRWDQNFYDMTVGGETLQEIIHTRGVLNSGDTIPYAFGLGLNEYRGLPTVAHGGSLMGFRTVISRFPQESFSVITLCNVGRANPSRLSVAVAELFLEDKMEAPDPEGPDPASSPEGQDEDEAPEPSERELQAYTGEYFSPELAVTYEFEVVDGVPSVAMGPASRINLSVVENGVFRFGGVTFRFQEGATGAVEGFALDAGRVRNLKFQRVR